MKRIFLIGFLIIIAFIIFSVITYWNFSRNTLESSGIADGIKYCDDNNECTEDSFDHQQNKCVNKKIIPCCGNGKCESESDIAVEIATYLTCLEDEECKIDKVVKSATTRSGISEETYLTCPQDCSDPKPILEENISEINDYPELEEAFIDLYSSGGFTDSEMKYFKSIFDIFKSKTDLHQADEEVLAYLVTNTIEPRIPPNNNRFPDINMTHFVEEIIPLANDITEGSSGDMESIEKIVLWVRENIAVTWTAGYEIGEDTPKKILEYREVPTHCDYWATLITALCRASGIPAREVAGSFASVPGHAWTEAYVNGEWVMVDSTGALERNPQEKKWLYSVYAYDPLNERVVDISLSYNTDILELIINHTKEVVGETSATEQTENNFAQYKEESDLASKYACAQDIMEICISEIIAKEEGYESTDIKVLNLWDWDKLIKEDAFLSELEKAKVISIYDLTGEGRTGYKTSDEGDFPLKKIDTLIPEIKQDFQGKIYSFFANYQGSCGLLSDAVTLNLFDPEDVDTLETAYQDLFTGPPDLLKNFVIEIASVVSKEKNYTTFYLPEHIQEGIEYSITTTGSIDRENLTAFNIQFMIDSMIMIQDIMMVSSVDQKTLMINPDPREPKYREWRYFDNLKLINEEGKVYADPEIYRNPRPDPTAAPGEPPYNCEDAPTGIYINPGQTLEIYSENDVVIIKGDITTEQIVVG